MATMKDFADLKSLRSTLKDQEQARAVEKAEREKKARVSAHEADLFKFSVGKVKPMPVQNKLAPFAPAPLPVAAPRPADDDVAAVLRESLSDQFDVEHLLDDEPTVSYTRSGVGSDVVKKMRKGHWPIQDELDLHGMRRDTAREEIGDFLYHCGKRQLRCVRVIYGKGFGSAGGEPVLRSMVHSWLEQKPEVIAFCVANARDGGHGALVVLLKAALLDQLR